VENEDHPRIFDFEQRQIFELHGGMCILVKTIAMDTRFTLTSKD